MKPAITLFNFAKHMAECGIKDVHEFAIVMHSPVKSGQYHAITGMQINRVLRTVILSTELVAVEWEPDDTTATKLPKLQRRAQILDNLPMAVATVDPLVNSKAPKCDHFWICGIDGRTKCTKCNKYDGEQES